MHHPRADIERLYIERENDGKELIQLESNSKRTIIWLKKYLDTTTDWMLQLVTLYPSLPKINGNHEVAPYSLELQNRSLNTGCNSVLYSRK